MNSIPEIIERIRAADKPCRIIDALVKMRFRPHKSDPKLGEIERIDSTGDGLRFLDKKRGAHGREVCGYWGYHVSPAVTRDVGAAVAFVEEMLPGAFWYIEPEPLYGGSIELPDLTDPETGERREFIDEHNASAGYALLLAALAAIQAREAA